MNPFSAFLQPINRPIQAPDVFGELSNLAQQRKEMKERARESDQNNAIQKGYLQVQQDNQSHQFAKQDQDMVEGVLKEYQDAVARGEPQQIQDAIQKMKRFGLDVNQAEAPKALDKSTSISPFTGLPFQTHDPMQADDPGAVGDGTSMTGVRANDPNSNRLLGQKEFEDQLIGDSSARPETMESGGETTPEGRGYIERTAPRSAGESMGADPGDAGRNGNVMDLDAESQPTGPSPGASPQMAPGLPGMLPMVVSRQGKELYRSGQNSRWSPLVQGVFGSLAEQQDPKAAAAGKRAQALAEKLVGVDGVSPEQAIKFAMDAYEKDLTRMSAELRTAVGAKARGGSSAAQREPSESPHIYDAAARTQAATIQKEDVKYASLEDKLNSGDPGQQRDALNELYTIRAGTAVSAAEDNRVAGIVSMLDKWRNRFQQWTGGPMSPDMLRAMQEIVASKREINRDMVEQIYNHQADVYESFNKSKVKPEELQNRSTAIRQGAKVVAGGAPKSEEDLY